MALQKQVNIAIATGVVGDFASQNPYHTLVAGRKQYRTGATGVTIATFAEVDTVTGLATNTLLGNRPIGFVGRQSNQALITNWLGGASMVIPAGYGITLYDGGDFYVSSKTVTVYGQNVFASTTDGTISTAAAATLAGHVPTGFKVSVGAEIGELTTIVKA